MVMIHVLYIVHYTCVSMCIHCTCVCMHMYMYMCMSVHVCVCVRVCVFACLVNLICNSLSFFSPSFSNNEPVLFLTTIINNTCTNTHVICIAILPNSWISDATKASC